MASLSLLFIFFLVVLQITVSLSSTLVLPLTKDPPTNQYLTQIYHGSQLLPTNLVLDLNSPFVWLDCASSKGSTVNCRSIQCSSAAANPCPSSTSSEHPCSLLLENPTTGISATGELVQDVVAFQNQISAVDEFLLSCAPPILLSGLAAGAKGILGFGRTRIGSLSQISHSFGYPKKFSLCLSSTDGMILSGEEDPIFNLGEIEVFKSMIYTPLLHTGDSYSINLKALKIQNKKLSVEELSSVRISTIVPYTTMESRVYGVFMKAFAMAAESSNMTRVPAVGQFGACYGVEGSTAVPVIDLVLQSEMVKWRIHGHNSMVKVNDEVMCLGFLDGGLDLGGGASIVLGGHQLEDNLLEFDLGSSMLGFSSSLPIKQTSCSQLSLSAMHKEVRSS